MKSNNTPCCGTVGPKKKIVTAAIPANPEVVAGTGLIYLGAGTAKVKGKASGLVYYVSDHRRHFSVNPADAAVLLNKAEFILRP